MFTVWEGRRQLHITGETTAERLLSAMNAARLNREELAEKAGLCPQTIFNLLHHDDHVPTVDTIVVIAAVFGVKPNDIFRASTIRGGKA